MIKSTSKHRRIREKQAERARLAKETEAMPCMRRAAWKDAERHLRKALQVVPGDPNLRNNFARVV